VLLSGRRAVFVLDEVLFQCSIIVLYRDGGCVSAVVLDYVLERIEIFWTDFHAVELMMVGYLDDFHFLLL